jgi:hypothetical protein
MITELDSKRAKNPDKSEVRTICEIDGSDCSPDKEGYGKCGDYVSECSWYQMEIKT